MFSGKGRFPVTEKNEKGIPVLVGTPTVAVRNIPEMGMNYCKMMLASSRSPVILYLDPAFVRDRYNRGPASVDEVIKETDKNSVISVLQAFDFAESVFARELTGEPSPRKLPVYITLCVPSELQVSTLCGTSLGLATTLAMLGFEMPRHVCATGFVSNLGNFQTGVQSLHSVDVDKIDCAKEKVAGCMSAGVHILLPEKNYEEFTQPRFKHDPYNMQQLGVSDSEKVSVLGVPMEKGNLGSLKALSYNKNQTMAIFVPTVADAVRVLMEFFQLWSKAVENVVSK